MRFIRHFCPVVALVAVALFVTPASAQLLWYNGDFDDVGGLTNERDTIVTQSAIYDDFIVPAGQTWNITSVFSNNLADTIAVCADWEIRSGVSLGNGGTLVDSATCAPVVTTPTGRSGFGFTEFMYESPVSVTLGPGTYWLTVVPVDSGGGRSFISTTSGANAVGSPPGNNGNSFWDSTFFGTSFANAGDPFGLTEVDFSMGINGTVGGQVIPEPGSVALLMGMSTGLLVLVRRRKK